MERSTVRRWLVKEEPTHYAYSDLERDGSTEWDSVHNPLAQRNLRTMRAGEAVLYYHTGTERAVVAIAEVAGPPHPDPSDERGAWSVRIRAVRLLKAPIPLDRLKPDPEFAASPLVRIGRLSVVEITPRQWDRVLALEAAGGSARAHRAHAPKSTNRPRRRPTRTWKRGST